MSLLLCKAIQIFYIIFTISPIYQNIKNKFCCTEKQQQFSAVMVSGKCPKIPDPCESQPHKGPLTSKLNSKTIPALPTLELSFIFPFNLLPSPVHLTGFSFCFLLSSNNNNSLLPIRQTINNIFEAGSWMLPIERALQEDGEVCDFFFCKLPAHVLVIEVCSKRQIFPGHVLSLRAYCYKLLCYKRAAS